MEMTAGIADAAYCFGTILAVQLIARLPARRLLVVYDTADTLGFLVEAVEPPPKCRRPLSPRKPPSL
jgi:hypothetical protein